MPTSDNSVFAGEVLRHGTVPREEIGGDKEEALCHLPSRPGAIHDHFVTPPALAD